MWDIIIRYLHFLGIIVLSSSLVLEHFLLELELSNKQLKRVVRVDLIYGISALVVLVSGLLLWFGVGKPAAFYTSNGFFHIKLTLFLLIAGLSVYPMIFFLKHRKTEAAQIAIPPRVIMFLRIELALLVILPLLGVLIARGSGLG
ncbi:MAG: DUF2214 family protein [Candidatus Marinimicrobia bacterium]|nr:DUF2214 family protein [Candidatus Neomarinimicrobiota bacterium]MCF7903774.1 DUF2214 family protein [Candidatus Neomarinimicrobiota bacterium]